MICSRDGMACVVCFSLSAVFPGPPTPCPRLSAVLPGLLAVPAKEHVTKVATGEIPAIVLSSSMSTKMSEKGWRVHILRQDVVMDHLLGFWQIET